MSTPEQEEPVEGSWGPTILVLVAIVLYWVGFSNNPTAVKMRRRFNMQVCTYFHNMLNHNELRYASV